MIQGLMVKKLGGMIFKLVMKQLMKKFDLEGIKKYAEDCAMQNHQQSIFIAGCLNKIAELQTRLIKLFEEKKKEPNLLGKILGL